MMTFALVGNQNCGKTTLFNVLTGSNQHVGNFPGVTVEGKSGNIKGLKNCNVVDLPGIYSIRPFSDEEIVTRDFVLDSKPDGIINIVDATNLGRNLYLTLQLLTLRIPTVIALNLMDEVRSNGGSIDIEKMSKALGVPVIPISAAKNEGISELTNKAFEVASRKILPEVLDFCPEGPIHRCIHSVSHHIEDHAEMIGVSPRFCAIKLIEGDETFFEKLALNENERETIEHTVKELESESGLDANAALALMRYNYIENVCKESVVSVTSETRERRRSNKIDRVLTGRFSAIPVFIGIMFLIFLMTFGVFGAGLSDLMTLGINAVTDTVNGWLISYGINEIVRDLIINGVFAGVGSVLSFLPYIIVLFFFLSILEDTGYMARVAFVTDKLLRKLGLSGKSIVPMLIGFGCTVPAVMSARTLSSDRDRRMTIMLTPYMSCSAKIPIYAMFAQAFFPRYAALAMFCLYFGGIILGILMALLFKSTVFKGNPVPFVMELPDYRLPSPKSVFLLLWEKAKEFVKKAFTVIFVATVIIWVLSNFDTRLNYVNGNSAQSILAAIGMFIEKAFIPCGFGDWRAVTALIAGFTAKEAVISTLGVLTGAGDESAAMLTALQTVFPNVLSAISFLAFTLLYTPCVAAVTAIHRELNSMKLTVLTVIIQCSVAWIISSLIYNIGNLIISIV